MGEKGGKTTLQRSFSRLEKLADGNLIKFKSGCIFTPVGQPGVLQEDGGALHSLWSIFAEAALGVLLEHSRLRGFLPLWCILVKGPELSGTHKTTLGALHPFLESPVKKDRQIGVAVFTQIHGT